MVVWNHLFQLSHLLKKITAKEKSFQLPLDLWCSLLHLPPPRLSCLWIVALSLEDMFWAFLLWELILLLLQC